MRSFLALFLFACGVPAVSDQPETLTLSTTWTLNGSCPPASHVVITAGAESVTAECRSGTATLTTQTMSYATAVLFDRDERQLAQHTVKLDGSTDAAFTFTLPEGVGTFKVHATWTVNGAAPSAASCKSTKTVRFTTGLFVAGEAACEAGEVTLVDLGGVLSLDAEMRDAGGGVIATVSREIRVTKDTDASFALSTSSGSIHLTWPTATCPPDAVVTASLESTTLTGPCASGEFLFSAVPSGVHALSAQLVNAGAVLSTKSTQATVAGDDVVEARVTF